jgi:hypothetical protein
MGADDGRLIGVARHSETEETYALVADQAGSIVAQPAAPAADTWLTDRDRLAASDPIAGRWRHFKGGIYEFIARAREATTGETLVIYTSANGAVWIRPERMIGEVVERDGRRHTRFTRDDAG